MRKRLWIALALLGVIPGLLFMASCGKKTVRSEVSASEMPETEAARPEQAAAGQARADLEKQRQEAEREQELERQRRLEEERLKEQQLREARLEEERRQAAAAKKLEEARKTFLEELVLFEFESSVLTRAALDILARKAQWLRENTDASVAIEGHCDERGSDEYNLALGLRRAETAKAYLADQGVSASRMSTISYGEERPFAIEDNEEAWSLNRRAHFVLK